MEPIEPHDNDEVLSRKDSYLRVAALFVALVVLGLIVGWLMVTFVLAPT